MGEVTTVMVRFFGSGAVSGSGGGGGGIFDFEDFWSEMRSPLRPPPPPPLRPPLQLMRRRNVSPLRFDLLCCAVQIWLCCGAVLMWVLPMCCALRSPHLCSTLLYSTAAELTISMSKSLAQKSFLVICCFCLVRFPSTLFRLVIRFDLNFLVQTLQYSPEWTLRWWKSGRCSCCCTRFRISSTTHHVRPGQTSVVPPPLLLTSDSL